MTKEKSTNTLRKRKTKNPCAGCGLHHDLCICSQIPKLDLKTRVSLIIHRREMKRTTNTGMLALKALTNSEMRIRGDQNRQPLDLSDLMNPTHRTLLFYPSDDAIELTPELIAQDPRPIMLIVPDGNWRQASKVSIRHPELQSAVRVKLGGINTSAHHLRAEHMVEGMATLQAIAYALGIIEGLHVQQELLKLYQLKLHQTLKGRGVVVEN
ncbi:MAG: DTW domain-containing protein [Bdellovibrionales bacterium RIFCSPHIGHO2_01_FULL_40_29]|nr:MAG: DTW domain-containing protein [Bdellovibrionales bacterium RIFCSPHIGHO2_01_FULL_40_29]OFZ33195.1 MAG: DTW domain-containing protein [Bdellovibrionales bacterium RIFCSPHIGHO2_02_FULL_40_15]